MGSGTRTDASGRYRLVLPVAPVYRAAVSRPRSGQSDEVLLRQTWSAAVSGDEARDFDPSRD